MAQHAESSIPPPFVSATRPEPAPVVFVTRTERRQHSAFLRAAALAVVRNAPLRVVLCASPPRLTSTMLFPQRAAQMLLLGAGDARRAHAASKWVARLAPNAEVQLESGDVATVAARLAGPLVPALFVVAAGDCSRSRDAVWLATETGVPVLVARRPAGRSVILAATDLVDPTMPVASHASALARRTHADLVAVHNAPVCLVQPMTPYGQVRALGPSAEELRATSERLADAVLAVEPDAETIMASEPSTARAVLDAARSVAADVIAIGARRRTWVDRLLFGSVAEAVVGQSTASVLVTPVGDPSRS